MTTKRKFLTHSGVVPPFPNVEKDKGKSVHDSDGLVEASSEQNDTKRSLPSRLLGLIRSYEKKNSNDEDYDDIMDETVDLFNHMIAVYSRHGLLQGDVEKADQILSTENSVTKWGSVDKKRGGKKSKKKKEDDLRNLQSSTSLDESLIFTALLRIFASTTWRGEINEDQALIISLASELCLSISQHIKVDKESDVCNLAEYEMLAQYGKAILSGLVDMMGHIVNKMREFSDRRSGELVLTLFECKEKTHALIFNSLIKSACSLVSLFTTKLSRSTQLLTDLSTMAWMILTIDNDSVQESAARLLSCLPLAGGIDRKSPSDIWSSQILDTLTALSTVLQTMAPLTQSNTRSSPNETSNEFWGSWIKYVQREISDEQFRLKCFYRFSRGLAKAYGFFLLQDGLSRFHSSSILVDAHLDIKMVLGVVESLVSFPLSSETVYYRTKRRLRDEKIDNGLLSPRIIATEVANYVKLMGHDILDCTMAAVGGPSLMPFARRILRISYASILTSSSGSVRKVMDPTSAVQLEGKKRRWLHLSIASRAVAIKTFGNAISAFGCDYKSSSQSRSNESTTNSFIASTDSEKAITLVVGCLVEQVSRNKVQGGDCDDDWGTNLERVELIVASASCLNKSIVSCGEFLSMPIRSLIESVVVNALSQMSGAKQPSVQLLSWSLAKTSLLRLACTCVTTPWQDGASSGLVELLNTAANKLKNDVDEEVSVNARAALRLCDTAGVPRAPALTYVTRAVSASDTHIGSHGTTTDAASLAKNIENARNDAIQARKNMEEMELAKKRKAEEKRDREEKGKREKAAKRQKALKEKVEKSQNAAPITKTSKESTNEDAEMDNGEKAKPELKDENSPEKSNSASKETSKSGAPKTETVAEKEDNKIENNLTKQEQVDEKSKEDKMETEKTTDGDSNNNESDDEAFPEIFDGGPDSDDE